MHVEGDGYVCGDLFCTASQAYWGDLAEIYRADADYEPGTLVKLGGEKEITVASESEANAVITSNPGFVLNYGDKEEEEGVFFKGIALTGRVPVRVKGVVEKFGKIYLSDEPGIGTTQKPSEDSKVIGRALESKATEDVDLVECTVQLTLD